MSPKVSESKQHKTLDEIDRDLQQAAIAYVEVRKKHRLDLEHVEVTYTALQLRVLAEEFLRWRLL